MQYPDVTRAISCEISGKRVTGRWLSALYRQRVRSTEASGSGNRSARSATSNVRFTPGRLDGFRAADRARCICACAMSNPRAVMLANPSECARMTSRRSHVPGPQPASRSLTLHRKPAGRLVSSPRRPRRSDPRKRAFRQRQMAAKDRRRHKRHNRHQPGCRYQQFHPLPHYQLPGQNAQLYVRRAILTPISAQGLNRGQTCEACQTRGILSFHFGAHKGLGAGRRAEDVPGAI
jgi:hypothetical protein